MMWHQQRMLQPASSSQLQRQTLRNCEHGLQMLSVRLQKPTRCTHCSKAVYVMSDSKAAVICIFSSCREEVRGRMHGSCSGVPFGSHDAASTWSIVQAREAAETAAEATAGQLAAADREAALLEDQLEQVTQSLTHAQRCKSQLEAKLHQYEQVRLLQD